MSRFSQCQRTAEEGRKAKQRARKPESCKGAEPKVRRYSVPFFFPSSGAIAHRSTVRGCRLSKPVFDGHTLSAARASAAASPAYHLWIGEGEKPGRSQPKKSQAASDGRMKALR